jgi:hypothetical protein
VDTTTHRLELIRQAVAGDGRRAGRFVSDMGRLPVVATEGTGYELLELCRDAREVGVMNEPFLYRPVVGGQAFAEVEIDAGYGWKGPYLEMPYEALYDGFGNPFEIQVADDPDHWYTAETAPMGQPIMGVRSVGRDGIEGPGFDWADADRAYTDFDAMTWARLTIRVQVLSRDDVDDPIWAGPTIVTALPSATENRTYAEGDIFLSTTGDVFRCKSNVTLTDPDTPSTWNTSVAGVVTTVSDRSGTTAQWEFLGERHQYLTEVNAVAFEPDTDGVAGVREVAAPTPTSGVVNTMIIDELTPGIRWLFVYGGLVGSGGTPPRANCYSSGLQSIELTRGDNFITVYLTAPLE